MVAGEEMYGMVEIGGKTVVGTYQLVETTAAENGRQQQRRSAPDERRHPQNVSHVAAAPGGHHHRALQGTGCDAALSQQN